jgi:hypothetical protein
MVVVYAPMLRDRFAVGFCMPDHGTVAAETPEIVTGVTPVILP